MMSLMHCSEVCLNGYEVVKGYNDELTFAKVNVPCPPA